MRKMTPSEAGSASRLRPGEPSGEPALSVSGPPSAGNRPTPEPAESASQTANNQIYSKTKYKQDCAMLLILQHNWDRYADMLTYVTSYDMAIAVGVWRLESAQSKTELQAKAEADLHGPESPGSNSRTFKTWLERLRKGPTTLEEDPLAAHLIQFEEFDSPGDRAAGRPAQISAREEAVDRRLRRLEQASARATASPSPEVLMSGALREETAVPLTGTSTADRRRPTAPEQPSRSATALPQEGVEAPQTLGLNRPSPMIHPDMEMRNPSISNEFRRNSQEPKGNRLLPVDVMLFDPAEGNVAFFTRRFRQIADLEGDRAVIRVLPMCLKGEALEWYTALDLESRTKMNRDITEWEAQLLQQYRPNTVDALKEAERLKFRFDQTNALSLNQYFTKKVNLLEDAGITDQVNVVRHLHAGLDAQLALVTRFERETTVAEFIRSCRFHEPAARRVWLDAHWKDNSRSLIKPWTPPARLPPRAQARENEAQRPPPVPTWKDKRKTHRPLALPAPRPQREAARPRGKPFRPCRHCGGDHYDPDCPTMRRAARAYQIAQNENDYEERSQSDTDEDNPGKDENTNEYPIKRDPESENDSQSS